MKSLTLPSSRNSARTTKKAAPPRSRDVGHLLGAIHQGIRSRGFYLLTDDPLELVCGSDYRQFSPAHLDRIAAFAQRHGFIAGFIDGILVFGPASRKMHSADCGSLFERLHADCSLDTREITRQPPQ